MRVMDFTLNFAEGRVLGCLLEKERTTPENYPLTLNSVQLAANQKSSREPVVEMSEREVQAAIDTLREKGLVYRVDIAGSRVPKFRHAFDKWVVSTPAERALVCVLLLRGPQTPGELRIRTERLHAFASVDAVGDTLRGLAEDHDWPVVRALPRQLGRKEVRWAQLLTGEPPEEVLADDRPGPELMAASLVSSVPVTDRASPDEISALRGEVNRLRDEVERLRGEVQAVLELLQ
jgi:uncharacterized protein